MVQAEELIEKDACQNLHQWAMQAGCAALIIDPKMGNSIR